MDVSLSIPKWELSADDLRLEAVITLAAGVMKDDSGAGSSKECIGEFTLVMNNSDRGGEGQSLDSTIRNKACKHINGINPQECACTLYSIRISGLQAARKQLHWLRLHSVSQHHGTLVYVPCNRS